MTATIPGAACPHVHGQTACDTCWRDHLTRVTNSAAAQVTRIDAALPLVLASLPDLGYGSWHGAYDEYTDDGWTAADVAGWLAAGLMDRPTADAHLVVLAAGYHAVVDRMPDRFT